jgi:hypothetical protein
MQVQDTSFLSLLLIMAMLPIAAKGLAELYIKIAATIQRYKHKNQGGKPGPAAFVKRV